MQQLHAQLRKALPWYDRWHNDAHNEAATWGLFLLVSLTFTSVLLSSIMSAQIDIDAGQQLSFVSAASMRTTSHGPTDTANIERLRIVNDAVLTSAYEHAHVRGSQKPASLEALRGVLKERQDTIRELALVDPQSVKRFIFDELALQSIPAEARDLVERPVTREGVYHIALVSDDFVYGGSEVAHEEYLLEVSPTEIYRLALTEDEAYSLTPEEKVTISGMDIGQDVVIPTGEIVENDGEGRVLGAAVTKKVAIIPFNFQNDTRQPLTVDQIRARIFTDTSSMNAFYKEMSYGQMAIQGRDRTDGDVYDWVTIPVNGGDCAYNNWVSLANKALANKGVSLTGYTNLQYIFPGAASGCGWSGLAYMPGSISWVRVEAVGAGISGHEFGHNVGFHHASSYGCAVGTNTTGTCTPSEYGDGNDVMGSGSARHTNNYNKARFWLDPAQVTTVSQSGTFTLEPTETVGTGVKLLRIKRPFAVGTSLITDGYYHLEFRTPIGFDSYLGTSAQANSVFIRLVRDYTTGGASKTYSVATVPVGQTFTDAEAGITVKTLSASASGATVEIGMTVAPCTRSNPTISISPTGQWGSAGGSLTYTATVLDNDSSSCGLSTFTVTPTLPAGFTQSPSSLSLSLNPLEQKSVSFTLTAPSDAVPATYTFTQMAQNSIVTTSSARASANYNIASPDVTAPVVSVTSPSNGAQVNGSKVKVAAAASDASGIARMELYVDDVMVKACSVATTCSYNWNSRRASAGTHTLRAVAFDNSAQQNSAETSITVTK